MPAPSADQTPATRLVTGLGGLALAVLFGALGVLILTSPAGPGTPSWAAGLIRAFVASMFGTMAGLGLYGFVTAVRGPRVPPLPRALLTRCAACGEAITPTTARCPGCGRAPGQVGRAWKESPREEAGSGLMIGGIGTAIASLGLFLLVSAFSGEERLLLSLAYGALGLLMLTVGAAMLFGALLTLRDALRRFGRRSFRLDHYVSAGTVQASAEISRRSASLRGSTITFLPFTKAPDPRAVDAPVHVRGSAGTSPAPPRGPLGPGLRALVRTVAVLDARGQVRLLYFDTLDWTAGAEGPPSRTTRADVQIGHPFARDPEVDGPEEHEAPVEPLDPVLAVLTQGSTVRAIADSFAADEVLRNRFEAYAAGLPPGEADPRTVRILGALLAGGGAAAPYRQPG